MNIEWMADRDGNRLVFIEPTDPGYDIYQILSPNGRWVNFTYASGLVSQVQDNFGRTVKYTYDPSGRLASVTGADGNTRTYGWTTDNRLQSIEYADGGLFVTNTYDSNGRVTGQTFADGTTFAFKYNQPDSGGFEVGQVPLSTDVTDRNGNVREVVFSDAGYIVSDVFPKGAAIAQTATFGLDSTTNNVTGATDALGRTTAMTFDGAGNRLSVTYLSGTNDGGTVTYTYTAQNQLASVTNELGKTTLYLYDAGPWHPTQILDPLGHVTSMTYDNEGRLLTVTDPLGNTTTRSYHGPDLATVTDPLSNVTEYQYDDLGRLTLKSTPLRATTHYAYDGWDRPLGTVNALGYDAGYTYDNRGNMATSTDENGNVSKYVYDSMNRLQKQTDALGNSTTTTYTDAGYPRTVTDRKGQQQVYSYDARNRLSEVDFHIPDGGLESDIQYTYDAADRLTQVVDSLAGTITRTYDGRDDLLTETTPLGTVTYTYDLARRRTSMQITGQTKITYSYDDANRLTTITRGTDTTTLNYDNANRRTSMDLPDGIVVTYGYDNGSRLTSVVYTDGSSTLGNLSYVYDAAGHLVSKGGTLASVSLPAAISSAVYNANNQLTHWNGQAFSYDLNGNLTTDSSSAYSWNTRNQLVSMRPDGGLPKSRYVYDGVGRRQSKLVNNVYTQFLYDETGNIVAESVDAGQLTTFDVSTFAPDELVCQYQYQTDGGQGATLLPITDPSNMSVIGLLSDGGVIRASYSYEPYGSVTYVGDAGTDQQYTGREDDIAGVLQYNRWRYYLPVQGRFISEDPKGIAGGINLYAYAGGNPIQNNDPREALHWA